MQLRVDIFFGLRRDARVVASSEDAISEIIAFHPEYSAHHPDAGVRLICAALRMCRALMRHASTQRKDNGSRENGLGRCNVINASLVCNRSIARHKHIQIIGSGGDAAG